MLQAPAYKAWLKSHLIRGEPIVFFPMCKGDGHDCYRSSPEDEGACPNGGTCDHVEPMFGIFSNHSFSGASGSQVYPEDVILHASDQDYMPYYRPMRTLEDSVDMEGNCKIAQPGFGRNEMYPCVDKSVTYGLALTGLQTNLTEKDETWTLPKVSISIGITEEPNVRLFQKPVKVYANVSVDVEGLEDGQKCVLFRYNSTDNFPTSPPFDAGAESATEFTADLSGASMEIVGSLGSVSNQSLGHPAWIYPDPIPFLSNTAVYYRAVC